MSEIKTLDKNRIIEYLKKSGYQPAKTRRLAREMAIPEDLYGQFRRLVRELLRAGEIVELKHNRLALPDKEKFVVGRIYGHRNGYAFLGPEKGGDDIFINPQNLKTALHGDKVLATLVASRTGRSVEGRVVKILERGKKTVVGTFHHSRLADFVVPDDSRFPKEIYIPPGATDGARDCQKVVVTLAPWEDEYRKPEGKISEILGYPGDPGLEILTIIREFDLPHEFPQEVEHEAAKIPEKIPAAEIKRRLDWRKKITFTIDPVDAKDHDDACSIEKLANGHWLLGVHIADVSYYVTEGSNADREALLRGTSVYLADRVIPMLPERLSNNLCSLVPKKDRLTFSCLLEIDRHGKVHKSEVAESIIESRAKLAYEQVQAFFDTGKASPEIKGLEASLTEMRALARILLENRKKRGSLDFDLPEPHVLLDKEGRVIDVYQKIRLESHRLIEEFMLLANQTVAELFTAKNFPILYRVHDRPAPEKMESFAAMMADFGYALHFKDEPTPFRLARFLEQVRGRPEEELVNELLLRSLKKAVYQPENIGHFGLAFDHYLHFTSPIRRYPDLLVHRLGKELLRGRPTVSRFRWLEANLSKIGQITSERERVAEEAERESVKVKQLEFMQHKLGEVYPGIVSGVTSFGVFVRIVALGVEGLVRFSALGDDYYIFEEEKHRLVGRRSKKVIRLADPMKVQVLRVDLLQKRLDLVPFGEEERPTAPTEKRPPQRGRRHR